jgi:hypothetical protein
MTATERLRQLLDERGVEWDKGAFPNEARTYWQDTVARPWDTQRLYVHALLTPEQAVEATLGRGTCDMEFTQAAQFGDPNDEDSIFDVGMFRCTACGTETYGMWNDNDECREWPRYCPNCGRRVES